MHFFLVKISHLASFDFRCFAFLTCAGLFHQVFFTGLRVCRTHATPGCPGLHGALRHPSVSISRALVSPSDPASLYSLMAQFRSQYTGAALKAAPMYALGWRLNLETQGGRSPVVTPQQ